MYYTSRVVLYFSLVLKSPFYENELLNCLSYIYIYIYHYTALKIFTLAELTSLQKMKSLTSLLVHMHHPLASDMKHALLPMAPQCTASWSQGCTNHIAHNTTEIQTMSKFNRLLTMTKLKFLAFIALEKLSYLYGLHPINQLLSHLLHNWNHTHTFVVSTLYHKLIHNIFFPK